MYLISFLIPIKLISAFYFNTRGEQCEIEHCNILAESAIKISVLQIFSLLISRKQKAAIGVIILYGSSAEDLLSETAKKYTFWLQSMARNILIYRVKKHGLVFWNTGIKKKVRAMFKYYDIVALLSLCGKQRVRKDPILEILPSAKTLHTFMFQKLDLFST